MMQLNFPTYNFKVKQVENSNYVFDILRRKYVLCTPEEWVRQHLVHYLITEKQYPLSLLSLERGLVVNGMRKRFDLLAWNNEGKPVLIAECKAPDVALSQSTFVQLAGYNRGFRVRTLLITNGLTHAACIFSEDFSTYSFVGEIPPWNGFPAHRPS
jgi:hypothetical protein